MRGENQRDRTAQLKHISSHHKMVDVSLAREKITIVGERIYGTDSIGWAVYRATMDKIAGFQGNSTNDKCRLGAGHSEVYDEDGDRCWCILDPKIRAMQNNY